jgi:RNA polymerase sigma-70 factor, ECF subfamily
LARFRRPLNSPQGFGEQKEQCWLSTADFFTISGLPAPLLHRFMCAEIGQPETMVDHNAAEAAKVIGRDLQVHAKKSLSMSDGHPIPPEGSAAKLRNAEFMRLFVRSEPRIYAYIRSLVVNQSDAEEVLQETATISWAKFDEFQPGTDFVRWAVRIAYWEVRSMAKRKRRDALVFSETFVETLAEDTAAMDPYCVAAHEALTACLEKLKHRDRDLFQRRYVSGLRVNQIAEQVGRPLDTIHSAFRRIRRVLTECIQMKLSAEQN